MTTKTPKAPSKKRAVQPDAADLYPQNLRFRINHGPEGVEDYKIKQRGELFQKLDQMGFIPQRPQVAENGLGIRSQDWWFVMIDEQSEREMLLAVLKQAQKQSIVAAIQTVQHGQQHPLRIDREALASRIKKARDD